MAVTRVGRVSRSPSGQRSSSSWNRFRKALLDERGWRCEDCGLAGKLEVHHIVPVSVDPARRYDKSNCRCLCSKCHVEAHRPARTPAEVAWDELLQDLVR